MELDQGAVKFVIGWCTCPVYTKGRMNVRVVKEFEVLKRHILRLTYIIH